MEFARIPTALLDEREEFIKSPMYLQKAYTCDGCDKMIPQFRAGHRYRCRVCPDFDLCRRCHSQWIAKRLPSVHEHLYEHEMAPVMERAELLALSDKPRFRLRARTELAKVLKAKANRIVWARENSMHHREHMVCRMFDETNGRTNFAPAAYEGNDAAVSPEVMAALLARETALRLQPATQQAYAVPSQLCLQVSCFLAVAVK
jgi:hypothetical protein